MMKEMPKAKPVKKEKSKRKKKDKKPSFPYSVSGRSMAEIESNPIPTRPKKNKWRCKKCDGKMKGGHKTTRNKDGSVRQICLTCEV